ncbi:hypothetical protein [Amycolatopsis sp. cmx-8-4]|uniref:hypothetical protein n=1 Tax=Amycolatopsis sp. cmx-8-4 TaxID=2790947 RepID=UPI00397ACFD6
MTSTLSTIKNGLLALAVAAAAAAGLAATAPAATAAVTAPAVARPASATFNPVDAANLGLTRVGQHGGQCKQWVNDIFREASHGQVNLGGGYFSDYAREGGGRINAGNAWRGDIIQLNNPGNRDGYYNGMHTAIIVSNLGSGNYDVVDSNYSLNEIIGHHTWNPFTSATRNGLEVNVWRF